MSPRGRVIGRYCRKQSVEIISSGTLKVIACAPHGLCMTQADVVNQELLAFLQN